MPAQKIKPFPETFVRIPTANGWSHRPVTAEDKERRALVLQLLSPHFDRKEKEQIRLDLQQLRWPCHE